MNAVIDVAAVDGFIQGHKECGGTQVAVDSLYAIVDENCQAT